MQERGRVTGVKREWDPGRRWKRQPRKGGNNLPGMARRKADSKAARRHPSLRQEHAQA